MTQFTISPPSTPLFKELKDTPENLSSFVQTFIASLFPPSKKQLSSYGNLYTPPASPSSPQFVMAGPHSDLYEFAYYIITRAELCTEAALSALALLARLRRKLPRARAESGPRLFLAAMIVASKGLFDIAYNNPGWYEIAAGCPALEADFALADINLMERQLLTHLDYRVAVFGDEIITLNRIYLTGQIQQKQQKQQQLQQQQLQLQLQQQQSQQLYIKSPSTNTFNALMTPPPSPMDYEYQQQQIQQAQEQPPPPEVPERPKRSRNSISVCQNYQSLNKNVMKDTNQNSIYNRRPKAVPLPPLLPVQQSLNTFNSIDPNGPLSAPISKSPNRQSLHRRWL